MQSLILEVFCFMSLLWAIIINKNYVVSADTYVNLCCMLHIKHPIMPKCPNVPRIGLQSISFPDTISKSLAYYTIPGFVRDIGIPNFIPTEKVS